MKLTTFLICALFIGCNLSEKDSVIVFPEGGYELPKIPIQTDSSFSHYLIQDLEPASNTFEAYYRHVYLKAFEEPDLMIQRFERPVFRLTYKPYYECAYIITLTQDGIVVKSGNRVNLMCEDEARLTELENSHLSILKKNYPLSKNNKQINDVRRNKLDSLISLYPKLLQPGYYALLLDKLYYPCEVPFTFTTSRLPISKNQFSKLVNLINASGYWKLPIRLECQYIPDYNTEFILEANTSTKYNIVKSYVCYGDSSDYIKACNTLVEFAGLDKEINLGLKTPNK